MSRLRPKSSTACRRRRSRSRAVVVFHRLASLFDAAASFVWSPTSEGFYLETRSRRAPNVPRKMPLGRGRDFNDNNDTLLKPRRFADCKPAGIRRY